MPGMSRLSVFVSTADSVVVLLAVTNHTYCHRPRTRVTLGSRLKSWVSMSAGRSFR